MQEIQMDDKFGSCEDRSVGFAETKLSICACWILEDSSFTSNCQDEICLRYSGLNWINNQALSWDADATSNFCSEEFPTGGDKDRSDRLRHLHEV